MNFTDGVWAVEYARGAIPLSMPFGLSDELLSVLDLPTAVRTLSLYTSLIGRHWGNRANKDFPFWIPLRRFLAIFMNWIGPAITKSLTPPPPVEINPPKPVRGTAAAGGGAANEPPAAAGHHGEGGSLLPGTGGRPARGPAAAPPAAPRARPRG